jgi:AcrR family transcriptional regulator
MESQVPARRRKRTEPRPDELVRAAYRLIANEGFEGLRTRDVAAAVGLNVATLHYYFPTKEALIRGVVAHAASRFRETLGGAGSARTQLRRHFQGLGRLARDEPELFAVMGEVALRARRDAALAKMLRELDEAWYATLETLLRRASRQGEIALDASPASLAALVVPTLKGLFMVPADARDLRRVDQTLAQVERLLGL